MNIEEESSGALAQILYDVEQEGLSDALEEGLYDVAKYELDDMLFYLISYHHYFPFMGFRLSLQK